MPVPPRAEDFSLAAFPEKGFSPTLRKALRRRGPLWGLVPIKTSLAGANAPPGTLDSTKHGFTNACKTGNTRPATLVTGAVVPGQAGPFAQPGKLPFGQLPGGNNTFFHHGHVIPLPL